MIDSLTDVISNEAKKLLQASQKDVPLSESEYDALEALCRCAKALKAGEKEDPPDDLEEESDEELLGKVGPGLPTGGSPGCAGS